MSADENRPGDGPDDVSSERTPDGRWVRQRGEERRAASSERLTDDSETLAALAAVEGRSVLRGDDDVSEDQINEFELAAGAVFLALSGGSVAQRRALAPSETPPVCTSMPEGAMERLQAAMRSRCSGVDPALAQDAGDTRSTAGASGAAAEFNAAELDSDAARLGRNDRDPGSASSPRAEAGPWDRAAEITPGPGTERPLDAVPSVRPRGMSPWLVASGWVAAAAMMLGLVALRDQNAQLSVLAGLEDPSAGRARLMDDAADATVAPWQRDASSPIRGDVAWSDDANEGYMRIEGLAANDPDVSQYQLWIFRGTDPGAEPHPVDGGVFDVSSSGEVIVPIDAKINVGHAGLFAVTVEPPGGVVVSKRESIVLLASR